MINFLHTYHPDPVLVSIGPFNIYWYGFFIVLGIIAAVVLSIIIAKKYGVKKENIFDLAFWVVLGGIAGARVFHIFIEWRYYLERPLDIFKIWQGGLAIHGAIIAGLIIIWFYARKTDLNFWKFTSFFVPGLALAQALGRWGNYFNQELFGAPTKLPWGIPIDMINRPFQYYGYNYFHPAFLYESLGNLLIFGLLIYGHYLILKKFANRELSYKILALSYLILYSILRFFTEFVRIDEAYYLFGLRHAQLTCLVIILASFGYLAYSLKKKSGRYWPALEKNG